MTTAIYVYLFIVIALGLLVIVAEWRIYEKAGKPGWACIVPIYNILVLLEIVGKPWWWLFLLMIPFLNIIISIWMVNLLSKSFGKDVGFTVGLILLSVVFYPILGFGASKYIGPAGAPPA